MSAAGRNLAAGRADGAALDRDWITPGHDRRLRATARPSTATEVHTMPSSTQPTSPTDPTSRSLVDRYLAAWSSHDGAAVAAFMADDVDFEDVPLGERLQGSSAVAQFVERFTATFSSDYCFQLVSEHP